MRTSPSGTGSDSTIRSSGRLRRHTLHAILTYAGSFLDEPGSADILVSASQYDGSGPLAVAGPYVQMEIGFQPGFVWEHLTTGIDPSPNSSDALVTLDFGYRWNDDGDAIAPNEYDLYSVLLHELTHALGLFSVVGSDGRSVLLNSGDAGLFSVADGLLARGSNGEDLYLSGGQVNAAPTDLVSGDVVFAGPSTTSAFGAPVPVYTPARFEQGSSLSHWDVDDDDAVMLPRLDRGIEKRRYLPWEVQLLADLGYRIDRCGDGAPNDDEECDDGDLNSETEPNACRVSCVAPRCGDGVLDGDEECDDGNVSESDGCNALCEVEREVVEDSSVGQEVDPEPEEPRPPIVDAGVPESPDGPQLDGEPAVEMPAASLSPAGGCTAQRHPCQSGTQALLVLLGFLLAARRRRKPASVLDQAPFRRPPCVDSRTPHVVQEIYVPLA